MSKFYLFVNLPVGILQNLGALHIQWPYSKTNPGENEQSVYLID